MNKKTKDQIAKDSNLKSPVVISEGTLVPISLVITFVGFVVWLTTVAVTAKANGTAITELKSEMVRIEQNRNAILLDINKRLSTMEGILNELRNHR